MTESTNRRQYLQLVGATVAVGIGGCTDSEDTGGTDGGDSGTEDNTDNGGDTDDGSTGDSGDEGTDTDDSDTDGTDESDTDGETDDSEEQADEDDDAAPQLAAVFKWTDSYVMEIEASDFEGTWRFNDGDWQLTTTSDGQPSEIYNISTDDGTTTYVVAEGQCFVSESTRREPFDPQGPAEDSQEYPATGRTTLDGEEVYEFDVGDGVYYVSVDTGYPVRFEGTDGTVVRFRSWGETGPITPPEMECTRR